MGNKNDLKRVFDGRGPHKFITVKDDDFEITMCVRCTTKKEDLRNLICCSGNGLYKSNFLILIYLCMIKEFIMK